MIDFDKVLNDSINRRRRLHDASDYVYRNSITSSHLLKDVSGNSILFSELISLIDDLIASNQTHL